MKNRSPVALLKFYIQISISKDGYVFNIKFIFEGLLVFFQNDFFRKYKSLKQEIALFGV